jgi:hypothetical protein
VFELSYTQPYQGVSEQMIGSFETDELPIDCFTDTLTSNTPSRRNNKYAQIFATADGWCRAFPMSKKSLAHEGLSLLFKEKEFLTPSSWTEQGNKQWDYSERSVGKWVFVYDKRNRTRRGRMPQKLRSASSNVVLAGRWYTLAAPKRLWDDCLERGIYPGFSHSTDLST